MKKLALLILIFCFPMMSLSGNKAESLHNTQPSTKAWVVMDAKSGTLLRYNRQHVKMPIASTTKLLTALAVVKNGDLNSWVTVSSKASLQVPSKMGLRRGEKWRRKDLLKALLIKSANDSAVALAESVSGSESKFCLKLNSIAKSLGCKNTHIKRASGLPASGQYSTAADLALITRAALKSATIKQILSWKTAGIKSSRGRYFALASKNPYVKYANGKVYGKTGYTRRAQRCYAGMIYVNGKEYVVVFLGGRSTWSNLAMLRTWTMRFDMARAKNQKSLSVAQKKSWQNYLTRRGFKAGSADGVWGVKTQNAFLRFQDRNKLYRDGLVGPRAWSRKR